MKLLIFVFSLFLLCGCYQDSIHISEDYTGGRYGWDSTDIFFYKFISAWKPAAGLSAFPDGGTPKLLYKNVSFYRYDRQRVELNKVFDFNNLPFNKSRWLTSIIRNDSIITFAIHPVSGWETEITLDPTFKKYRQKFGGFFEYNLNRNRTKHFSKPYVISPKNKQDLSASQIKKITGNISYKQWGIDLSELGSKSNAGFIQDLITLEGNHNYRKAVVEQIVSKLNAEEIKAIIEKMNAYRDQLSGLEQTEYEITAEETIDTLKKLLRKPDDMVN